MLNALTLPKKYQLLPSNHPTVMRRLVNELNYRDNGFYVTGSRYNQARFSKGQLQVRLGDQEWVTIGFEQFIDDGYGNRICASRTRCGS